MSILACVVLEKSLRKNFILQTKKGRKVKRTSAGKNKLKKAGSQSHDTTNCHQSAYQYEHSSLHGLLRYL